MRQIILKTAILFLVVQTAFGDAITKSQLKTILGNKLSNQDSILHYRAFKVNGKEYYQIKLFNDGNIIGRTINKKGENVSLGELSSKKPDFFSGNLSKKILESNDTELLPVKLLLKRFTKKNKPDFETGSFGKGKSNLVINGKILSDSEKKNRMSSKKSKRKARLKEAQEKKSVLIQKYKFYFPYGEEPNGASNALNLLMTKAEILNLKNDSAIMAVSLRSSKNSNMVSANISTYVTPVTNVPGQKGLGVNIYYADDGCPANNYYPAFTNLDGSATSNHTEWVGSIIRTVASLSPVYCRSMHWSDTPRWWDMVNYDFGVISQSGGDSLSAFNNTYIGDDWEVDQFVDNWNTTWVNSAGNEGAGLGHIISPGKGMNVLTVGAYWDHYGGDVNDRRYPTFSSFVNPNNGHEKPEISAPGVSITAGPTVNGMGTSGSVPQVAGMVAALVGKYPSIKHQPAMVKAVMMAGSPHQFVGGSIGRNGYGGPHVGVLFNEQYTWGYDAYWYTGGVNDWTLIDNSDADPGNFLIDINLQVTDPGYKHRIVINWIVDANYTYTNSVGAAPLAIDIDATLSDPSMNLIHVAINSDNPFEVIEFTPPAYGVYRLKLYRTHWNDVDGNIKLGVAMAAYPQ